jgi:ferritin
MLRSFVREQFVPEKMVFTVVADIDEAKLEKQVLKIIDHVFSQSH